MWQRPLLVLTVLLASVQLSVPFSLAPSAGHASLSTRSAASPFCHPITRAAAKLALRASPEPAAAMGTGSAAGGKKVKGILFDIDGTLFDSDPVHFEVFVDLFLKEGVNGGKPIDNEFFRKHIAGRQNALICKDFFPEWDTARAEAWSANKEAVFRERAFGKLVAMPGLEELMQWIDANGIAKAAVTNAPRPNAEFMLDTIGRREWFDTLIIGDECERAKPDPLPYTLAMERLGLDASEALVFEDSPSGARAGVASGARTVGVLSSQPPEALAREGCALLIRDYRDPAIWELLQ